MTHKALQELLLGQDFGKGPRQSLPPSLSSLPQTFRSFSAQCPLHHFCQTSKAHPWFLLQTSNGTRQETRQRNRTEALRENDWKNTDGLNFIPLCRQVKLESEDYLTNTFCLTVDVSPSHCELESFEKLCCSPLLLKHLTLPWCTLGFWEEKK